MGVDFNRYQVPGVYVDDVPQTIVTPGGLPTATVTLVGAARGYQVQTEVLALSASAVPLSKKGVLPDSDSSPDLQVTTSGGTVLVEDTDYTLVRGATASASTTITRVGTSTDVSEGEQVTVSYSFADAAYYSPQVFEDYSGVETVYGPALVKVLPDTPDATQVASPLSLATRIAFENGASRVLCLAVEPSTAEVDERERFAEAYLKLATNFDTTLLVPVFASGTDGAAYTSGLPALISDARAHCVSASNNGYGRVAFVGADTTYDDSEETFDGLAESVTAKRVVLAYPHRMNFYNSHLGQTTEVGGPYLAAAYAGRLAAQPINRGLTQTQVYGFAGIPFAVQQQMSKSFKDTLSAAGVAVTEYGRDNRLVVRHGTSTDPSDILTREVSVTRSTDALYQLVSEGLVSADLIGDPIDMEMTTRVKGLVIGILEQAVGDLVVREYLNVQVRQQALPSGDPTAIEVAFTYRPFLPLNYITVSFSMDLSTAEVTVEELVAA